MNEEMVKKYLERLKIDDNIDNLEVSKEVLDKLVSAHQLNIPFETIGLRRNQATPSLDLDDIYQKIIIDGNGGYCFELNTLFEALLISLGFDVRGAYCRSVRGRDVRMPINHKGLIVSIDGNSYFVDVGFGGPMAQGAIDLNMQGEQSIEDEIFFVEPKDDAWFNICRLTRGSSDLHDDGASRKQVELEVCTIAVEPQDFDALNLTFSQPGTLFRDHDISNLRTSEGNISLKDNELTIRENGNKEVYNYNDDEIDGVLKKYFDINY